jgi:hypothetical protein
MVLLFALTTVLILRVLPICGGDGNGSFGFLFAVFTFVTTQIALALALAQTHYAAIVCRNKCHIIHEITASKLPSGSYIPPTYQF